MTSQERYHRQVRGSLQFLAAAMVAVLVGASIGLIWGYSWIRDTLCVLGGALALASMAMAFIALGTEKEL